MFTLFHRVFFEYRKVELLQIAEKLITYPAHMYICPSRPSLFTLRAETEMITTV